LHKLIVAQRPDRMKEKRSKDIVQAESLLAVLLEDRPHELVAAWDEAAKRGKAWRQLLTAGLGLISADVSDRALKAIGETRALVPGLDLEFASPPARYDFDRDIVFFSGTCMGSRRRCAISREALEDYFGDFSSGEKPALEAFRNNRSQIENLVREKFLHSPIEDMAETLLKSDDIPSLRARLRK
jgi:hypothetical protein